MVGSEDSLPVSVEDETALGGELGWDDCTWDEALGGCETEVATGVVVVEVGCGFVNSETRGVTAAGCTAAATIVAPGETIESGKI